MQNPETPRTFFLPISVSLLDELKKAARRKEGEVIGSLDILTAVAETEEGRKILEKANVNIPSLNEWTKRSENNNALPFRLTVQGIRVSEAAHRIISTAESKRQKDSGAKEISINHVASVLTDPSGSKGIARSVLVHSGLRFPIPNPDHRKIK